MGRPSKYSGEVRERAVRLVVEQAAAHESQWAAICSVAAKLGCGHRPPAPLRPLGARAAPYRRFDAVIPRRMACRVGAGTRATHGACPGAGRRQPCRD